MFSLSSIEPLMARGNIGEGNSEPGNSLEVLAKGLGDYTPPSPTRKASSGVSALPGRGESWDHDERHRAQDQGERQPIGRTDCFFQVDEVERDEHAD